MRVWLLLALAGCAERGTSMADAGLVTSVLDVAATPVVEAPLVRQSVDGVTWVQGHPASRPLIALNTPDVGSAGEITVWAHRLRAALAHDTGVPTTLSVHPGAVVVVFDTTAELPEQALITLSAVPMDDVALASALLTRPDGLGPVRPEGIRALHAASTAASNVTVRSSAPPRDAHRAAIAALPDGMGVPQPDAISAILATP